MINVPKGYRLTGTYRLIGAIGKMEDFTYRIFAGSVKQAYDKTREELYKTHDHILVKKIVKYNCRINWRINNEINNNVRRI